MRLKSIVKFIGRFITAIVLAGTTDSPTNAFNRITILCNMIGLLGIVSSYATYAGVAKWGVAWPILPTYATIMAVSVSLIVLNHFGKTYLSRLFTFFAIYLTAWNAMIFYGKSFNGYLLFFPAIVFSIIGFSRKSLVTRWTTLLLSVTALPVCDYFYHARIFPITGLDSRDAPFSVVVVDTFIVLSILVAMVLIERFLAEHNETELQALNQNLESIVHQRTILLTRAREEAMAASLAKSQFIANTSHELRTPLGAIIGFVDLALNAQESETAKQEYLEIVSRNAKQLLQIVNEILDLSKIEAQKLEVENLPASIFELTEEVGLLMALKADEKGLSFKIERDENLPKQIFTDPLRLKQILINLIGNAIKFTERGSVRLKVSALPKSEGKCEISFDVLDTGPGIVHAATKNLFQPFSQGDSTMSRKHGGTGLGLSLSQKLAELLGGKVELLRSTIGQGSVFRLKIECDTSMAAPLVLNKNEPAPAPIHFSLENRSFLVVDDSIDNQYLIKKYLILAGASVDIAVHGQDALDKIDRHAEYSAVLMDLQMPVMDGYEATRIIRSRGLKIPIVAITAHAMTEDLKKNRNAGFTAYLTKPLLREQLISTLQKITAT